MIGGPFVSPSSRRITYAVTSFQQHVASNTEYKFLLVATNSQSISGLVPPAVWQAI